VGTGDSDITLVESETKLTGYNATTEEFYEIVSDWKPNIRHILPGYFKNTAEIVTHDLAVVSVTPNPTLVERGELVNVTVVVENQGTVPETLTVTAYYDIIDPNYRIATPKTVQNWSVGASQSFIFTWDTAHVVGGVHTVIAVASPVSGELDTDDNTFQSSETVTVQVRTIYIRADGSIDPPTSLISTVDNITYTLTGDIASDFDGIVVDRNNIVVDGVGYSVQGTGTRNGITLSWRSNVTIKNTKVTDFNIGIGLWGSSNITLSGNNVSNNGYGIRLLGSSYNNLTGNTASSNSEHGILLDTSSNNTLFHNNLIDNTFQAGGYTLYRYVNTWDDGYPYGGNYWSDYEERYPNATEIDDSGIWDTPYVIDENNQDKYPLMNPWIPSLEPTTWTVDDDGPADFHTIQEAIDAASNGDTIYVYNGTYREHPIIGKDDLMIVGENKNDTIIDGDGIGAVVRVTAANVTISGFTVQNSGWRWYYDEGSGFYLGAGPKVTIFVNISDNIISNCYFGISLSNSLRNTINGNTISNAGVGVSFFDSAYNNLSGNTISDIEYDGIVFWNPYDNDVTGNLITNCSGVGVRIDRGNENTIIVNTITESDYGVLFHLSDHNVIQENSITGSEWNGISLFNSSENTVTENNITNNRNGIVTQWAQNNSIYHNNFVDNTNQVYTESTDIWDNGLEGNYWSDYEERYPNATEIDDSGIWDTPYIIDEKNQDNYPLVKPWSPPAERKVGVKVGDWTLYQVNYTYSTNDPEPPLPRPPSEVFEISQFRFYVQNVHETNVTFRFTTYYKDGTEETIERFIDVNTGEGIPVFLIGANLTADNIIYPNYWSEIRINETISRRYLDVIRETNHFCIEASVYHDSYEENSSIHIYWDRATGFLTESMFETIVMDKTRNYTTYYLSSLQIIATNLWSPKPPSPVEATQEFIETIETWNLQKGTENSLKAKLKVAIHMLDMEKENGATRKLTAFTNRVEMLREKKLTNEQADCLISEAQRITDLIDG